MEDFFVNIDSRYRDSTLYPNESKFKLTLNRTYKNIMSIKFMSIEIINTVSYIDSVKNNNYLTFHFPSKEQDPDGTVYTFPEGFYNTFSLLSITLNSYINANINNITKFESLAPEKYFYFFYIVKPVNINIIVGSTQYTYTVKVGWYSLYGFVNYLQNFIKPISTNNFTINTFDLPIYDVRFKSTNVLYNNIRIDTIQEIQCNLNTLKQSIYSQYITDTVTFKTSIMGSGILDTLVNNTYIPSTGKGYVVSDLESSSKYGINSTQSNPNDRSSQLYMLNVSQNATSTKTIINSASGTFYSYDADNNSWGSASILNPSDINLPTFELNITTNSLLSQGYSYPSIGYYMGFRDNLIRSSNNSIIAPKLGNYIGDPYVFIRLNDWGHIEQFNKKHLAKILLTPDLGLVKLDEFYAKEYKFKQPQNIQSLSIELVDYLGNTLDLRGLDYSFTLYMSQINNSDLKSELEYNFFDKSSLQRK